MESLLCNEVWLMSPYGVCENTISRCDERHHVDSSSFISTKEDHEEALRIFLDKEASYMPGPGYLKLIKSNNIIHNARFKGAYWLIKSQQRMNLSPETAFLAVNYMDRFISLTKCQGWKYWMFELLYIACLSVACKFNEATNRPLQDFQEEGLDHSFSSRLIQKMELTLLKELRWRMNSTTPFSYIHLLIQTIDALNKAVAHDVTNCITRFLLNAILDTKFIEFQPSVMVMSSVRCIFEDLFRSTNNDDPLAHFDTLIPQDQKGNLMKCQKIMGELFVQDQNMFASGNCFDDDPSSPVTVLKVDRYKFYDCPFRFINVDLRRSSRKRKREEDEHCGL